MKTPTKVIYILMCCTRAKRLTSIMPHFPTGLIHNRLRSSLQNADHLHKLTASRFCYTYVDVRMYVRLVGFYKAKCVKHLIIRILIGKHQSAALGPRHRLQLYTRWLKTDRWTDTHTRASANVASNKLRRASNVAKQHDSKRSLSNEQRGTSNENGCDMAWYGDGNQRGLLLMRCQPEWRLWATTTTYRGPGVAAWQRDGGAA